MSFQQILRTQVFGSRTTRLLRLRRVCRAEVAAPNLHTLVILNIVLSLAAAEFVDSTCPPASSGGGRPAASSRHEVCLLCGWMIVFVC